ncbi:hypothetical protein [Aquibacillus salsiterrae]|uniref:Uncharacterized protein n=1 Tax=Aquibacillus salsiterrae TaxID=2950439 RepID=A0A9X3WJR6_9BACI|nr:hypothetical protein [Aquibacillus salsiterrae]MDC3418609.1 hypothetical protein [Aquibacillus salsiterrae]
MSKLINSTAIIQNKVIAIEHDKSKIIKIYDQPLEMPHFSEVGSERLQHIDMMDFQGKISMILRTQMMKVGIQTPLKKGQYSINIVVRTPRMLADLPLLETMKSILDGINGEIIFNDADIYHCRIKYVQYRLTPRATKVRPHDLIDITINDLALNQTLVSVRGFNTYIVPKRMPYVLNAEDDVYFYPLHEFYHLHVSDVLQKEGFQIKSPHQCSVKLEFRGGVASKDIDNMAKCYLPILTEGGFLCNQEIISLELSKNNQSNGTGAIIVRVM